MTQRPGGEVLVYEAPDGGVRVEVKLERDTVWLTQRRLARSWPAAWTATELVV